MPPAPGACPHRGAALAVSRAGAFWALGVDGQWPRNGEVDVVEHANLRDTVAGTLHFASAAGQHQQLPAEPHNMFGVGAPSGAFNSYRVELGCDYVRWLVNGRGVQQVNRSQVNGGTLWPFDRPLYLLLNQAVGGTFPGYDVDTAGGDMLVDYVRVQALAPYPHRA
jgi:beta-glucanase (GH16 family)